MKNRKYLIAVILAFVLLLTPACVQAFSIGELLGWSTGQDTSVDEEDSRDSGKESAGKGGEDARTDDGEEQSALSREKRIVNLNGCMAAKPGAAGHRILLVDDVYTTGSTAREAARALKSAGALSVGMLSACCAWYRDKDGMI